MLARRSPTSEEPATPRAPRARAADPCDCRPTALPEAGTDPAAARRQTAEGELRPPRAWVGQLGVALLGAPAWQRGRGSGRSRRRRGWGRAPPSSAGSARASAVQQAGGGQGSGRQAHSPAGARRDAGGEGNARGGRDGCRVAQAVVAALSARRVAAGRRRRCHRAAARSRAGVVSSDRRGLEGREGWRGEGKRCQRKRPIDTARWSVAGSCSGCASGSSSAWTSPA